jgi:pimeloyl-ACP methyl ester carboxylesterase
VAGLLVPGWGAPRGLYRSCLPEGWDVLELPTFRATHGELTAYRRWLVDEIARQEAPVTVAGHSMGAALAVLAAVEKPGAIGGLILVSPAGLPLSKPVWKSVVSLLDQIIHGLYPVSELRRGAARMLGAPRAALRLANTVRDLDLRGELNQIRATGIPCTVIGCSSDMLTTAALSREIATGLGATYRELTISGGHVWMLRRPELLRSELSAAALAHRR